MRLHNLSVLVVVIAPMEMVAAFNKGALLKTSVTKYLIGLS
jgi:hypothetical protein